MSIAPELLRRIVEGALLAAAQPLSEDKLLSLIDEGERPEKADLKQVLEEIAESCTDRGFELRQVASGWRFQVPEDLAPWINKMWEEKPQKYSRATLETLAIIAYRQPITRGDIEEIRGVAVSSHIVKSLSERGWIKVVGQRDVPGKPSLYATTREFLDYFNLKSLEDLPTLAEIRDIDSLNAALDLGDGNADAAAVDGEQQPSADGIEAEAGEREDTETSASEDSESGDAAELDDAGANDGAIADATDVAEMDEALEEPEQALAEAAESEAVDVETTSESSADDYPEAELDTEREPESAIDETLEADEDQEANTPETHTS